MKPAGEKVGKGETEKGIAPTPLPPSFPAPELLVTCPVCGQRGFTERGLRAHRCARKNCQALTFDEWQRAVVSARKAAHKQTTPSERRRIEERRKRAAAKVAGAQVSKPVSR